MSRNEAGYSSLKVLLVLLLLSVVAIGIASLYHYALAPIQFIRERTKANLVLNQAVATFWKLHAADSSPLADGRLDPVWGLNGMEIDGWTIRLRDGSSRLNLNWINLDIIANTRLAVKLINGQPVEALKQHREEVGYSLDLASSYREYFDEADLDSLFTADSYANVSVSHEECLEDLYRFRTDDKGDAVGFHAAVTAHLQSKKLWTAQELESALGASAAEVYPFINTWPAMNVNFVPEEVLEAVLTYPFPDGPLPEGAALCARLAEIRKATEITPQLLRSLLRFTKEQQKRVLEFLGTKTWVWDLTIEKAGTVYGCKIRTGNE